MPIPVIITFIQDHPGLAALVVSMFAGSAYAFEATVLRIKGLGELSLVLGFLGLMGCLAGALRTDMLDIVLVAASAVGLVVVAYRAERKRAP